MPDKIYKKAKAVELNPEISAKFTQITDALAAKHDEVMLKELGIDLPPEHVLVMRGVNAPAWYAFFDNREGKKFIRVAHRTDVEAAVEKARKVIDGAK